MYYVRNNEIHDYTDQTDKVVIIRKVPNEKQQIIKRVSYKDI